MSPNWKPLLTGPEAVAAAAAVADIAAALTPDAEPPGDGPADPSLASGDAGTALFFAYLALADLDGAAETHIERASSLLERAAGTLATTPLGPGLHAGFPGVAWAIEHATRRLFAADANNTAAADGSQGGGDDDDFNRPVDEALLGPLSRSPWTQDFDLMRGLVGLGVYALERLPQASGAACLEQVVERLAELAEAGPDGCTWHTRPDLLPEWQREGHPTGLYNLGLSHGVPGVIALLAAAANGPSATRVRPLLDGAVRWLLAQRLPPTAGSCFGYPTKEGELAGPSRLAWCYGDPGIAAALLAAARATGDAAWEAEARAVALDAAARGTENSLIRDAGLCHGAAGLGHLFNRLYQATGEEELGRAARFWIGQALTLRRPGEGVAGFAAYRTQMEGEAQWVADPAFLEGAAGIGLALLAALSPVEPAWDRVLLLSAAPTAD